MRIVCLAWGSLIWKTGSLRLASGWRRGGPELPIEFARVGDSAELATVICPGAPNLPTRWAVLDAADLDDAQEQLREREGIAPEDRAMVGRVPADGPPAAHAEVIAAWARSRQVDGVVWTALPPRFDGTEGRMPTVDEAVAYLGSLKGEPRAHAMHYVIHVPAELRTAYRRAFANRLGWRSIAAEAPA